MSKTTSYIISLNPNGKIRQDFIDDSGYDSWAAKKKQMKFKLVPCKLCSGESGHEDCEYCAGVGFVPVPMNK